MSSNKTRHGIVRAACGLALAALVGSCYDGGASAPAPVYAGNEADAGWGSPPPASDEAPPAYEPPPRAHPPAGPIREAPLAPPPAPLAVAGEGRRITVARGDSLSLIARRFHVSEQAIIAANHLRPPYQVDAGQRLAIPGDAPAEEATAPGLMPPEPIGPPPAAAAGGPPPAVVPLDTPAPPAARAALTPAPAPPPPAGEESVAEEAREDASLGPAMHGGRFPWPVRGRVVGTFGTAANGAHNDGINIAAPAGTPIRAVAAGEVAYAGNELRGYGNLVLIKHAGGWISAYAHCQELLVRKGEHVASGQVIARVGTSGGVSQPQLHFELRRGRSPVDPRRFLAPSQAAGKASEPG